jgi:anti-sigma factor RsiW
MTSPSRRLGFVRDHRWVPPHASAYLDGELTPRQRHRVERHTRDCPECRELLAGLRALIEGLGRLRGDDERVVAGTVLASIRSRLGQLPRESRD